MQLQAVAAFPVVAAAAAYANQPSVDVAVVQQTEEQAARKMLSASEMWVTAAAQYGPQNAATCSVAGYA